MSLISKAFAPDSVFGRDSRLRTGNAILPAIRCTQSCTQNRIISNLYRTLHEFNPKSRVRPCRYSEPFNLPQHVSVHSVQLAGSGWRWSADSGPRLNLSLAK